jgi:hypothetical protein
VPADQRDQQVEALAGQRHNLFAAHQLSLARDQDELAELEYFGVAAHRTGVGNFQDEFRPFQKTTAAGDCEKFRRVGRRAAKNAGRRA